MSTPSAEQLTELLHALAPFTATIGASVVSGSPESVVLEADWAEERTTAAGALHGGFLMTLADACGAMLATFHLPEGAGTSTTDSNTHFLRAARSGPVRATSRVVKTGRSLIVVQSDVTGPEGELLTTTIQSQIVLTP